MLHFISKWSILVSVELCTCQGQDKGTTKRLFGLHRKKEFDNEQKK
jgi:hypothetical protein